MKLRLLTSRFAMLLLLSVAILSCSKDTTDSATGGTYILGIGITSNGTTTNYAVQSNTLNEGSVSAVSNGITLAGYRDYSQGDQTIFAIGGFSEANVNALELDASGMLQLSGSASFDRAGDDIVQVNDSQMLAIEYPSVAEGNQARFYFVNIADRRVSKSISVPVAPLTAEGDQPVYSGLVVRGNQLFVSHLHFDGMYNTNHVDTNYVAVYSFPELVFQKLIKDTRTGPSGAWQTKNALFKDEKNDVYAMSSSNLSNGYSKSTKPGGFLRIRSGETVFDPNYFFNTDLLGGKISHIRYLGNGKVFAAISTLTEQTAADRWGDKSLKLSIIDVYSKTITDVTPSGSSNPLELLHNGVGGRSFPVLVEGSQVYYPISGENGTFIYRIDTNTAKAYKGAEVSATFVGGIFKVK